MSDVQSDSVIQKYQLELKSQDDMYQMMKSNFGEEHQSCAYININKGQILMNLDNMNEAEALVKTGIDSIRQKEKTAQIHLPRALTILSRIHLQKACQEALMLYRTAAQDQKMTSSVDGNQAQKEFAIVLMNVAQTYKAVSRFQECIDIQEQALGLLQQYLKQLQAIEFSSLSLQQEEQKEKQEFRDAPQSEIEMTQQYLCVALNNLGSTLLLQQQFDKSRTFLEKAVKLNEEVFGSVNLNVAKILQNLSSLYIEIGESELSMLKSSQALEIYEKLLKKDDKRLANAYLNHSKILLKLERFDFAKTFIQQSVKILSEKQETEFSYENVLAHQYLAEVFKGEEEVESALFCLNQRIQIIQQMQEYESEELLKSIYDLALYQREQKMQNCVQTLFEAIQLAKIKTLTVPIAVQYMFIAAEWMKNTSTQTDKEFFSKMETVLNLQSEALNLVRINDPSEELKIAEKQMLICQTLNHMKQFQESEKTSRQNIKLLEKYDSLAALAIQCQLLKELSFSLDQLNKQNESLVILQQFVRTARKLYQTNPEITIAFNTLILKLEEAGNQENLIKGLLDQYNYYVQMIGDPPLHYNVISTLSALSNVYESIGQKDEAAQYKNKSSEIDDLLMKSMMQDEEFDQYENNGQDEKFDF